MKRIFVLTLLSVVATSAMAQDVRVYRPEITAKNYEVPKDEQVETIVFTLKNDFIMDMNTSESRIHVRLNKQGREELYFFTAAREGKWLTIKTESGYMFNRFELKQPIDSGYLVSRKYDRRYDLAKVARTLRK